MKQVNHNAVDLLLRSLARGGENPLAGEGAAVGKPDGSAAVSAHLDADELNLYAEGVLPAPARSRYTQHLADCQRCRQLVVGLAQAAGGTARPETTTQPSGTSFWQSLATVFSIPVLRYALPAILLTGVIAVGLLALREQRRPDLVAKNQQSEPAVAVVQQHSGNVSAGASPASVVPEQAEQANTSARDAKNSPADSSGLPTETPVSKPEGFTTDGTAAKDPPESGKVGGVTTAQPIYAPEPAAPPPPPKVFDEVDKSVARKEDDSEREVAKRNQDEFKVLSKDDSPRHGPARSRTMSGGSAGSRRDADVVSEDRAANSKKKNEAAEEVETQVSGRRFRRQANAWIDTAYQASRGATSVGRGTEQFRALMADEPGLRAIVQRLGGEVVVVWKGRAYRFR